MGGGSPMGGIGGDIVGLLRSEAVREELEIDEEQIEALRTITESTRPRRPDGMDFRSMSEEERREFFSEMRAKMEEKTKEAGENLLEVLTPGQMERLEQISVQVRGAGALADPKIAKKLALTEEQTQQLINKRDEIRDTMREKMREIFQSGNRDPSKLETLREEIDQDVLSVLTDKQRAEFDSLKGEKFDMPSGGIMGGGRGRRSGGPGGEGRPGGGRRGGDRRSARPSE